MKAIVTIICFSGFVSLVQAQQDPVYSLQNNMPLLINPAYSAMHNHASANIFYRLQWTGFDGAPSTAAFSGQTSLGNEKAGIGVNIIYDKHGVSKNTELSISYGYSLQTGGGNVIFGLQGGVINVINDYQSLTIRDQDNVFDENISEISPNFGAGIIYSTSMFFAGISIPRLLNTRIETGGTEIHYYERHYYATVGSVFALNHNMDVRPWLLLRKAKGLPGSYDIRADFIYNKMLSAGIGTRSFDVLSFSLGFMGNEKLRIAYQFELPVSDTPGPGFNSHEIVLGINFSMLKGQEVYYKYF